METSETARAALALVAAPEQAELIGSAAGTSRVAVAETAMPSEVVPGDSAVPARVEAAVVAPPAWDLVVVEEVPEVAAVAGVDRGPGCQQTIIGIPI